MKNIVSFQNLQIADTCSRKSCPLVIEREGGISKNHDTEVARPGIGKIKRRNISAALALVRTSSGKFYFSSFLFTCHCASFRNVIPFTAAQGPAAEVPAGGRSGVVDGTAPLPGPGFVRLILTQVPARGIDKEKAARFLKTPFAEVLQTGGVCTGGRRQRGASGSIPRSGCRCRSMGQVGSVALSYIRVF